MAAPVIGSEAVMKLLERKHSKDVFVPECKDGPTHTARHVRLDAWVMPRSWAHPSVRGYEVKVSRSDFLRDNKWPRYLDLCNEFYFVAPAEVILPAEVPDGCGLLQVTRNGGRLLTKVKAPQRDVTIPEEVFRYILMCRAVIEPENQYRPKAEEWAAWLEDRNEETRVGHRIAGIIHQKVEAGIRLVRHENNDLQNRIRDVALVEAAMKELGIVDLNRWGGERSAKAQLSRDSAAEVAQAIRVLMVRARRALEVLNPGPLDGG